MSLDETPTTPGTTSQVIGSSSRRQTKFLASRVSRLALIETSAQRKLNLLEKQGQHPGRLALLDGHIAGQEIALRTLRTRSRAEARQQIADEDEAARLLWIPDQLPDSAPGRVRKRYVELQEELAIHQRVPSILPLLAILARMDVLISMSASGRLRDTDPGDLSRLILMHTRASSRASAIIRSLDDARDRELEARADLRFTELSIELAGAIQEDSVERATIMHEMKVAQLTAEANVVSSALVEAKEAAADDIPMKPWEYREMTDDNTGNSEGL